MLKTHLVLMDELKSYRNPAMKITSLVKTGELTRVVRGLYETDPRTPGHLLAASIYGPSYLSFEYALAHHGLIPEAVASLVGYKDINYFYKCFKDSTGLTPKEYKARVKS